MTKTTTEWCGKEEKKVEQSVVRGKEIHVKLSEDTRQKQADREEARTLADRRKTTKSSKVRICAISPHRDHILLCPSPQTTVC